MKSSNAKILLFIIFAVFFLTLSARTEAFSQCQSEKKGYCVRLDPPNEPKTIQRNFASLLFAASDAGPPFPGLEFLQTYGIGYNSTIGQTLSALYNFGVAIAGISALIMFTYGGILYVTAVSPTMISQAKTRIINALLGLLLVASSYLILYTINHDFAETLSDKRIPSISKTNPPPAAPPP